ncbi:MAG: cytochrome P450 [Acidimicrobiia bacterium]
MGTNSHAARPVVDFDFGAARSRSDSDEAWRSVREAECPVAWTEHSGGHWVVTGYDAVAAAFRDWERFSSERTDPDRCAISFSNGKVPLCLPEESDPPAWQGYRRAIAPILAPQASERLRARAEHWTTYYLDRVVERGECELVNDLTCPVPAAVTLEWMGFPREEWQWFSDAFHGVSAYPNGTPEHRKATEAYAVVMTRITEELRARIASPRDDALTAIAHTEIDGVRISEDVAQSIAFLTVTGGIDTTTSFTGAALIHLSQHPDDRARLIADPELLPVATEEFLRYYPPARTHARTVAVDTVFEGVEMRKGERVLLSEVASGRDESAFENAGEFVIDRYPNRHLAFGVGIHRCPGSHLARMEFEEMITAVLRRMPDYVIAPEAIEEYPDWAMVGGWRRLPATFTPTAPGHD